MSATAATVTEVFSKPQTFSKTVNMKYLQPGGALEFSVKVELVVYLSRPDELKFVRTDAKDMLEDEKEWKEYEPLDREQNEHLSDVELVTPSRRFKCHMLQLSRRSKVFQAMFSHSGLKETQEREVCIKEFEDDTIADMISFIYDEKLENSKYSAKLLTIADKYDIELLKQRCEINLAKSLNDSNVTDMWIVANKYQASLLKDAVLAFLRNNWDRKGEIKDLEKVLVERAAFIKDLLPFLSMNQFEK